MSGVRQIQFVFNLQTNLTNKQLDQYFEGVTPEFDSLDSKGGWTLYEPAGSHWNEPERKGSHDG